MRKRWFFFLVLLLLVAVLALSLSPELRTRLFPGMMLRGAISEAYGELQQRFAGNPVLHIMSSLAVADQQIHFRSAGEEMQADMSLHLSPRCLSGTVTGESLNAAFYADSDSLAISSRQLTEDRWLGIRYDRFSEDISQIPLIRWILPDSVRSSWEDSLDVFRSTFTKEIPIPQLSRITQQELQQLSLILAAMKTTVSKTVIPVGQKAAECFRIRCEGAGGIWNQVLPSGEGTDTKVSCVFYLLDSRLVLAQISLSSSYQSIQLHLESEGSFAADPIFLDYRCKEDNQEEAWSARIATERTEGMLSEQWELTANDQKCVFSYQWEESTGNGAIQPAGEDPLSFRLSLQPQGFHLETTAELPFLKRAQCTIDVQPGEQPQKPDFRTPDTWTTEDLLTLLEGLGSVLMLPFP